MGAPSDEPETARSASAERAGVSAARRLRPLLERVPPHAPLATLPTPVERAPYLDDGAHRVWVKRDDASSGIYGGGKVRKLEWILPNLQGPAGSPRPVVSVGGVGSHHLLSLALFLRERGGSLHAWTFLQDPTPHTLRNLAAMASLGVRFWHVPARRYLPIAAISYKWWMRPSEPGAWLAAGASSPEGMLGFVAAAFELVAQVEAGVLSHPGTVYVTAGTAGTAAGLAVGFALARFPVHLRMVSAVERLFFNGRMFRRQVQAVGRLLERQGVRLGELDRARSWHARLAAARVEYSIEHGHVGRRYGAPTPAAAQLVGEVAPHGLHLETTYTGKCAAALRRDLAGEGDFRPVPGDVLLWNTHGSTDVSVHIEPDWPRRLPPGLRRWALAAAPPSLLS